MVHRYEIMTVHPVGGDDGRWTMQYGVEVVDGRGRAPKWRAPRRRVEMNPVAVLEPTINGCEWAVYRYMLQFEVSTNWEPGFGYVRSIWTRKNAVESARQGAFICVIVIIR